MELAEAEARAESNMLRAAKMVDELRAEQGNSSKAETEKKEVEVRKLVKLLLTDCSGEGEGASAACGRRGGWCNKVGRQDGQRR